MMSRQHILVLTTVVLCAICAFGESNPGRFVQDRFAVGFWVDPPADADMAARYREIAEAHFTLVLGSFGAHTPETVQRQLDLCAQHGMKALVWTGGGAPEHFVEHPACWGYMLRDEPSAEDFPAMAEKTALVRAQRPGKLAFINLLPNYASLERLGAPSYADYVRRFVQETGIDVLCMDHYPRFAPGNDGRAAYCENLAVLRECALEAGIPFWNFFNTMPFGPHTDPTEAQLRWQIYTSLAYGARGVLYFCYYTPLSHEFPKGGAIIERDGRRTRHYDQAQRINFALRNLGPALMRLESTAVIRIAPGDDPAEALAGAPIRALDRAAYDPELDLLIGVFRHEDGRRAVMLNNYCFAYTAWPTVVFDAAPGQVLEVSKTTGETAPVRDDSPDLDGLQISLDAGEGRLFILPAE